MALGAKGGTTRLGRSARDSEYGGGLVLSGNTYRQTPSGNITPSENILLKRGCCHILECEYLSSEKPVVKPTWHHRSQNRRIAGAIWGGGAAELTEIGRENAAKLSLRLKNRADIFLAQDDSFAGRATLMAADGKKSAINGRRVVITLDDLPVSPDCPWRTRRRQQIFDGVMSSLQMFKISTIGFAIGGHVTHEDGELLDSFVAESHLLGNHSFTHRSLDVLSLPQFEAEVLACDSALASWLTKPKRFRYPLLRTGNDAQKRDLSIQILLRHGYSPMWATIDNDDWKFNLEFTDAVSKRARAECAARYVDHVVRSADFYFDVGRLITEDNIAHTVVFHFNAINAENLHLVFGRLADSGWRFVHPQEAFDDPVYSRPDIRVGHRGVSWLYQVLGHS